jgi:hypothetical protein
MKLSISFEEAKQLYVHRYTMEHVPNWAKGNPCPNGKYYAPQYRSDKEWYDNTLFPGEGHISKRSEHCESSNQSWPLGQWLNYPYEVK